MLQELTHKIFTCTPADFEERTLEVFRFQYANNPLYATFTDTLRGHPDRVDVLSKIPFLPIRFFKTHRVKTTAFEPGAVFESSGTTGTVNSKHFVRDTGIYKRSFLQTFHQFYGDLSDWCIIGLLPSYLERQHSSLVVMADELIKQSGHPDSGFYLNEYGKLYQVLQRLEAAQQKTLLIGVTFALLDFVEEYPLPLQHTIVLETGGMKGRRQEMTREEVHALLKKAFGLPAIHSEYGMTELLSQAYSKGEGIFNCPPWMKVLVRGEDDPFEIRTTGNGVINIIDLANIYSCSFIATDDAGKLYEDGSFEVKGRTDNSDLRGCSLMISDIKQ